MIRALAAASFALLALSQPALAQDAGCAKDTDCKGARICVDHACVDAPAVKSCARDLDCPGDDICEQHLCLPPANATAATPKKSKTKGKPARRDLIKEAARKAAEQKAAEAAAAAARTPPAPAPVVPAPGEPTPPPEAPPSLITVAPPAPAPAPEPIAAPPPKPAPTPAPVPAPAPVTVAPAPAPAPVAAPPPTPPADLITPPPPLVAAAPPPAPEKQVDTGSPILYGIALTAGLHVWSSDPKTVNGMLTRIGGTEVDFGLDLNGDVGFRLTGNFGIELIAQGSYTPMLQGATGLLAGVGLGVRLDHLGALPGHFLLGGMASFAAISADNFATENISGGAIVLQYGLPLFGPIDGRGQLGYHFLSDGVSLFTLSVGIAFGN